MTTSQYKYKKALIELKKCSSIFIKSCPHGMYFRNGEWLRNDFLSCASDIVINSQHTETKKNAVDYLKDILKNF